jgi:acyl-homoserine lactone acylase PvdQ
VFADRDGNIQYVKAGCTPIRPEGDINWSVPVPGVSDATRWQGFHEIGDLVQIKNPPQGYMQNCNTAPSTMMKNSPMTRDKYLPYVYNLSWEAMTPRGERLGQLLDPDESVTREEAMAYTVDVYDILADPWKDALRAALKGPGASRKWNAEFMAAVSAILEWDGQFTRDSVVAPIIKYWRMKCDKPIPVLDIANGKPLGKDDQVKLLDLLAEALAEMKAKYGDKEVTWGDINLIGRGGRHFPCPGVELGGWSQKAMTETVFDVDTREEPEGSGNYVAFAGSSAILLTFLRPEGIESYSICNWGQSADPESPHYVDQAEKLYAEREFKPTWFDKEDLMEHVESEKTLVFE